ncbi:hypothetical protein SAMN00790413_03686 [Deinococcus hopiensis KR-140]|uniref:Uncharacterized protein n=1 Tax=Deinococcus hopiensis KR-140 TaxID=695939 RepID=A0A1W1UYC0_9DEIO|nr:hypothetical protein SAMN00790413_03686 [Deinococcus hopiensis KR-140]
MERYFRGVGAVNHRRVFAVLLGLIAVGLFVGTCYFGLGTLLSIPSDNEEAFSGWSKRWLLCLIGTASSIWGTTLFWKPSKKKGGKGGI